MKRIQKAQKKQTAQNSLKSKERKGFGKEDVLERRGSREGVLIRGAAGIRRFAGRYIKWTGCRKVHVLEEYAQFVEVSRQYMADGLAVKEALEQAIQYCMEHGILYETLRNYRAEVLGMLLEEFDVDKYERTIRKEGMEEGIEHGLELGVERSNHLARILIEQNRVEDLKRAAFDPAYQNELFQEFHL